MVVLLKSEELSVTKECTVINKMYNMYMYASISPFAKRTVLLANSYLRKLNDFNDEDKKGVWIFQPVQNQTKIFYIANKYYNGEYLGAGDRHTIFFFSIR